MISKNLDKGEYEFMKVYISSLGNFEVTDGEKSLIKESAREYKLYRLLQYFLTFRNKKILPETIIDHLFKDIDFNDPKNVLRAQIFRLRKELKSLIPENTQEDDYIKLSFSNGHYMLEVGKKIVLDVDEFERFISMGDRSEDPQKAIKFYYSAINLYCGEYLGGNIYESWLVPTRNYYRRQYLRVIYRIIDILKDSQSYEEIIEICEKTLINEKYEEMLHINLIEALLNLGQVKDAKVHYEYMTTKLELEMGIKSSTEMSMIYEKIKNLHNEKLYIELDNGIDELADKKSKGALLCEPEHFKSIYEIQNRRVLRSEDEGYILIISLSENINHGIQYIELWIKNMTQILKTILIDGDVYTIWNKVQILALLYDAKDDRVQSIEQRIMDMIEPDLYPYTNIKHVELTNSLP